MNEYCIRGVSHNLSFLGALVELPSFTAGEFTTNLIAEQYPDGFNAADVVHDDPPILIAACGVIHRCYRERAAKISGQLPGYEPKVDHDWVVVMNGENHSISVRPAEDGYDVSYRDTTYRVVSDWQFGQPLFRGRIDGAYVCIQVERRHLVYRLFHWGAQVDLMVLSARAAKLLATMPAKEPPDLSNYVLSPMPGLLSKVLVAVGDGVRSGQEIAVVEAMKMENVLRAERDGKIANLLVSVGDTLKVDQPIVEFE